MASNLLLCNTESLTEYNPTQSEQNALKYLSDVLSMMCDEAVVALWFVIFFKNTLINQYNGTVTL